MTRSELTAALERMPPDDRAFLKAIVYSDSPTAAREARTFLEVFHHFPGSVEGEEQIRMRGVVQDLPPFELPSFVRADVQRAWEAFA